MEKLRDLQYQFQNYILGNHFIVSDQVLETPEVDKETRLKIYGNAYLSRLVEILESDFPGLLALLGEEEFHELTQAYLNVYPSIYRSVRWFAKNLVNFLTTDPNYQAYPVLAEMASLEWKMRTVLDAPDSNLMTIDDFKNIPGEQWPFLKFKFHPALQRLDLQWNVVQVWQSVEEDREMVQPELLTSSIPWLFWRGKELEVLFCSLAVPEAWAIDVLLDQANFADMCEGLCQWVDEDQAGPYAANLLQKWLNQGLIAG